MTAESELWRSKWVCRDDSYWRLTENLHISITYNKLPRLLESELVMQAGKLIDSQFRMAAANQQYITGVLKAFTFFPKLARECFRQTHKRVSAVFIRHKTCTVQSYLKRSSYAKVKGRYPSQAGACHILPSKAWQSSLSLESLFIRSRWKWSHRPAKCIVSKLSTEESNKKHRHQHQSLHWNFT